MKIKFLLFLFLLSATGKCYSDTSDTLRLFYDIDKHSAEANKNKLDSLIQTLLPGTEISIFGYADYLGSAEHNMILSQNRADKVKEYFQSTGNKNFTLVICEGKGVTESASGSKTKLGEPENRRVDIIIKKVEKKEEVKIEEKKELPVEVKVGSSFTLEGLLFQPSRHFILRESQPVLDSLLEIMLANKNLKIEIQGHICCDYPQHWVPEQYNKASEKVHDGRDNDTGEMHLSVNRAKYVYDFLKENGVDASRMTYKGFGSSQPKVYPERSGYDQQTNRRVEIKVIEK